MFDDSGQESWSASCCSVFMFLSAGKFNQGVSADAKKQTWVEITEQINGLGENHREVTGYKQLLLHCIAGLTC